jgi:signal peptidase I
MKNSVYIVAIILGVVLGFSISCTSSKKITTKATNGNPTQNDTVRIANDELQYEVIIIDIGFSTWLNSRALPRGYHSQSYLEGKNRIYVSEWNIRVLQPQRYRPNLYEITIDYSPHIDYGYEVNYLIYNYMIYFQNTYKQKFFGYVPLR